MHSGAEGRATRASRCGCAVREGARDLQQLRGEMQPSWVHQRNLGEALKDEQAQQVGRVGGFLSVPRCLALEPLGDCLGQGRAGMGGIGWGGALLKVTGTCEDPELRSLAAT